MYNSMCYLSMILIKRLFVEKNSEIIDKFKEFLEITIR